MSYDDSDNNRPERFIRSGFFVALNFSTITKNVVRYTALFDSGTASISW